MARRGHAEDEDFGNAWLARVSGMMEVSGLHCEQGADEARLWLVVSMAAEREMRTCGRPCGGGR